MTHDFTLWPSQTTGSVGADGKARKSARGRQRRPAVEQAEQVPHNPPKRNRLFVGVVCLLFRLFHPRVSAKPGEEKQPAPRPGRGLRRHRSAKTTTDGPLRCGPDLRWGATGTRSGLCWVLAPGSTRSEPRRCRALSGLSQAAARLVAAVVLCAGTALVGGQSGTDGTGSTQPSTKEKVLFEVVCWLFRLSTSKTRVGSPNPFLRVPVPNSERPPRRARTGREPAPRSRGSPSAQWLW